ncbi:MAG: ECF transporter S component [Niameybacter sp.]|uniref:ECF transporter S component n=1 Tax=Niameybacter sp. TaxID=2033640 RepID=UPI002FCC8CD7
MKAKNIVFAGLFIALGALMPQVFHVLGGPGLGKILLPMHLPVLIAGFMLNPPVALLVGILSPVCSFLYTGGSMPPVPTLYFMMIELGIYGFVASLCFEKYKLSIIVSLVLSMILGRVVHTCVFLFVTAVLGMTLPPALSIGAILGQSVPGIILQVVFIPPILYAMNKKGWLKRNDA